jgi:arginine/ornithine transport system substrate-binding protein
VLRVALVLFLALLGVAGAAQPERAELRVGLEISEAPFAYVNDANELAGFHVDVARALCARLRVRCVFGTINVAELVQQLQGHAVDLVPAVTITEPLRREVDFTDPHYRAPSRFIARRGKPLDPAATGLRGRIVGVQRGTAQNRYVTATFPGATVRRYADKTELYLDLALDRLDTALIDVLSGRVQFLGTDLGADFDFVGPALDDPAWFGEGVGIAVRKGDDELRTTLNQALRDIRTDGTFDAIRSQYFAFQLEGT